MRISAGARLRMIGRGVAVAALVAVPLGAQTISKENIERGHKILTQIRDDLKARYYDQTFHGLDLEARYRLADSSIARARDLNEMFTIIAAFVLQLRSSHTSFNPPNHVAHVDYGFATQPYGQAVYVTLVRKGSDAEKRGLKRGDVVLMVDNFKVERKNAELIDYLYNRLSPRPGKRLVVRHPDGKVDTILTMAKINMGQRVIDYTDIDEQARVLHEMEEEERMPTHFYREIGDSVLIWRMPEFVGDDDSAIDDMMKLARKHRAVIFDLRRDGGGAETTLKYLLGQYFDHRVLIGTTVRRDRRDSLWVDPVHPDDPYRGLLIVLIDSWSASAAEIFARTTQLESRGIIVGDVSAGAVERANILVHDIGFDRVLTYVLEVSISDLIMSDGNRLEGIGVTPDSLVVPGPEDIAEQRDVAMAKALAIAGVTRTPEEAAALSGWRRKKE